MSWLYVHEYVNVDTETRNCHLRNEGVPISNSEKLKSEKHTFLHSLCGANSDLGTFTSYSYSLYAVNRSQTLSIEAFT